MSNKAIFQVTKINVKGKRQERIIEVNLETNTLMNKDLNLEVKKSFSIRLITEVVKEEDPLTVQIRFSDVRQNDYKMIFQSPGERLLFCEKIDGVLNEEKSANVGHLKTVFNVIKVNIRGAKQDRTLGVDATKECLFNFEKNSSKVNKTFPLSDIKEMQQFEAEPNRLVIFFRKYGHDYNLYFETASDKQAFVQKIEDVGTAKKKAQEEAASEMEAEKIRFQEKMAEEKRILQEQVLKVKEEQEREEVRRLNEAASKAAENSPSQELARKAIFQVVKVNKRGKRQDRIVEIDPVVKAIKNLDLNDSVKKSFKFSDVKDCIAKDDTEAEIHWESKKQPAYSLVFSSKGERDMFVGALRRKS